MHTPGRGEGALRRYRVSIPASSHFLTLCTASRSPGLGRGEIAPAIRAEMAAIEADAHWIQRAAVIMQDHIHLLVRLVGPLPIARCIAGLKTKTRQTLLTQKLRWQPNFHERRLRPDDPVEDVLRYIFLNPYRGGIAAIEVP